LFKSKIKWNFGFNKALNYMKKLRFALLSGLLFLTLHAEGYAWTPIARANNSTISTIAHLAGSLLAPDGGCYEINDEPWRVSEEKDWIEYWFNVKCKYKVISEDIIFIDRYDEYSDDYWIVSGILSFGVYSSPHEAAYEACDCD